MIAQKGRSEKTTLIGHQRPPLTTLRGLPFLLLMSCRRRRVLKNENGFFIRLDLSVVTKSKSIP